MEIQKNLRIWWNIYLIAFNHQIGLMKKCKLKKDISLRLIIGGTGTTKFKA